MWRLAQIPKILVTVCRDHNTLVIAQHMGAFCRGRPRPLSARQ